MKKYEAFSLTIESDVELPLLRESNSLLRADVSIRRGSLTHYKDIAQHVSKEGYFLYQGENHVVYSTVDGAVFSVRGVDEILYDAPQGFPLPLLAGYILGGCMGTILNWRDFLVLHASTVCRNGRSVIIMGESGAGKSTTAREFISHGWEIMTDDVAAIRFAPDGTPFVVPSYPSQKLWQDGLDRYALPEDCVTPLIKEFKKEKFHVNVENSFHNIPVKADVIIWLKKAREDYSDPCLCEPVSGFTVADRLLRNTYRGYSRDESGKNKLFQQCVDMSSRVSMLEVLRPANVSTVSEVYRLVCREMNTPE